MLLLQAQHLCMWSLCMRAAEARESSEASMLCVYTDGTHWHQTTCAQWLAPALALNSGSSLSPLFKMQVSFQLLFYIENLC